MTDLEKIRLLENENLSLRVEIAQLKQELAEVDEMKEQMAELMNETRTMIASLKHLRNSFATDTEGLRTFKNTYMEATKEAMKQTVRPYAKAVKNAKKRHRKTY